MAAHLQETWGQQRFEFSAPSTMTRDRIIPRAGSVAFLTRYALLFSRLDSIYRHPLSYLLMKDR